MTENAIPLQDEEEFPELVVSPGFLHRPQRDLEARASKDVSIVKKSTKVVHRSR